MNHVLRLENKTEKGITTYKRGIRVALMVGSGLNAPRGDTQPLD